MLEHLVVLSSKDQGAAAAVQQRCRVVSALPPRLLVVAAADEQVAHGLRVLPGVDDVISGPTSTLPDSLNETERLFVQAWQQGRQSHEKQRPGDGLNWGAEGFSPPDRPDPVPR